MHAQKTASFHTVLLQMLILSDLILQAETIAEADTEMGISGLERALSDSEHSRRMLHNKYVEEKKSHEQAEQESIELRVANEEL